MAGSGFQLDWGTEPMAQMQELSLTPERAAENRAGIREGFGVGFVPTKGVLLCPNSVPLARKSEEMNSNDITRLQPLYLIC